MYPVAMPTLAFHANFAFADRRVIAPSRTARRALARQLGRLASAFPIMAFSCADTHIHLLVLGERAVAVEVGRRLKAFLVNLVPDPGAFTPLHCEPVQTQSHLVRAFHYVLGQDAHHGARADLLHEGTNLPDLLGLRLVACATRPLVRAHLPRVTRAALLEQLGVEELSAVVTSAVDELADCAAAARALPDLRGRSPAAVSLRHAAVHASDAPATSLADALSCSASTVRRWRQTPPDEALLRAVQLQVDLRRLLLPRLEAAAHFETDGWTLGRAPSGAARPRL
jgi:hypothetical protein